MVDGKRKRQFRWCTTAAETVQDVNLDGKTFAITGTTSGIGIETARSLVLRGAHIVMINRNLKMSEAQKNTLLLEKTNAKIDIVVCDLNSLKSVEKAAKEYTEKGWPIHGLILNAGIFGPSSKTTSDGFESHLGVNHLAHFLLIRELLPVVRQSAPSRIVVVSSSSSGHTGLKPAMSLSEKVERLFPKDSPEIFYKLYSYSKMNNVLTAFKLHRDEFEKSGISIYAVHPGVISTDIWRDFGFFGKIARFLTRPFFKNVAQGAATQVYCAAHPEVEKESGKFWDSCWDDESALSADIARDIELQEEVWRKSEKLINSVLERN